MAPRRVGQAGLALHEAGRADGPPLLLLHGFLGAAGEMLEAARALIPSRRLLALDLPGHGASPVPATDGACSFEAVIATLREAIATLQLGDFDLWGYSLGGRLAIGLALQPGVAVRRLILESASPGLSDPRERSARAAEDDARAQAIRADLEGFLAAWESSPLFSGERRRISRSQSVEGLARAVAMLSPGRQPALGEKLAALPTATLWLTGDRDEKYVAIARALAPRMRAARHVSFPGVGHAPHRERPDLVAAAVATFLEDRP